MDTMYAVLMTYKGASTHHHERTDYIGVFRADRGNYEARAKEWGSNYAKHLPDDVVYKLTVCEMVEEFFGFDPASIVIDSWL